MVSWRSTATSLPDAEIGCKLDEGVTHGPLINSKAVGKAHEHVLDASSKGAKIVIGGNKMKGNFYVGVACRIVNRNSRLYSPRMLQEPTILTGAKSDWLISDDETFGKCPAFK